MAETTSTSRKAGNGDYPKGQRRFDNFGPIVLMAYADKYVMVRRPSCIPFTLHESKWLKLPLSTPTGDAKP